MTEVSCPDLASTPVAIADVGNQYCLFQEGTSIYAILATAVREITPAPPLVPIPRCPSSLVGICHLRSEFLPVIQLAPLLGECKTQAGTPTQLLVLSSRLGPWALMMDRAISIESMETHVDSVGREESQRSAVMGTATYQSEIVRVLDPQVLLQLVQRSRHHQWESGPRPTASPAKKISPEEVA